jgi:FkbM family methyltransferase
MALGPVGLRAVAFVLGAPPPGLGQHAVARRLHARLIAPRAPSEPVVQRLRGGARFELHLEDRVQGEAFLARRYESALVEFICRRLPETGGVVVDVGAHVGLVAIQVAALRAGRGTVVHAVEPSALNATRLRRNLALNDGLDVRVQQLAIGARDGEAELVSVPGGRDMGGTRVRAPEEAAHGAGEQVPMVTLDTFVERAGIDSIDVLKVDVEGHETAVLEGASTLLAGQRARCVVCELNDAYLESQGIARADVVALIERWGYRETPIPPVGAQRLRRGPRAGPVVDVAFEPEREA